MIKYIWSKEIDKEIKENIEDSIKLQIVNIYLKNVRPLTINLKLINDRIEGNVINKDNGILKSFYLSGNNNVVVTTILKESS